MGIQKMKGMERVEQKEKRGEKDGKKKSKR
jgi:hypothetical protein